MRSPWRSRLGPFLTWLALAAAAWQLVTFIRAEVVRVPFVGDLAWTEGHSMEEAWRVAHGVLLYGDPAKGEISQQYTPGFQILVGSLGRLLPLDYALARGVSVLSFFVMCGAVILTTRRQGPRGDGTVLGALAVGCLCAVAPDVAFTYDVARPDPLAMCFTIVSAVLIGGPSAPSARRYALAGLVATLAVYTKQTAAPFPVWLGVFALWRGGRRGLLFTLAFVATSAAALVALQVGTHGWFLRWVTLSAHEVIQVERVFQLHQCLFEAAPYLPVVPLVFAFALGRRWVSPDGILWSGMLAAAVPATAAPFLKIGGGYNNLSWMLLMTPLAASALALDLAARPGLRAARREVERRALHGLGAAYLAWAFYSPTLGLPRPGGVAGMAAVDRVIGSLEGGAVCPTHPFLVQRRHELPHQVVLWGYLELHQARRPDMSGDIGRDIREMDPRWLVLSEEDDWILRAVGPSYELRCRIEPIYYALDFPSYLHLLYERVPAGTARPVAPRDVPICPAAEGAGRG